MTDGVSRKTYDVRVRGFLNRSPEVISFGDVPWPCDGDADDMLAVMLTGEETTSSKIKRIKELALFWHPDKFLSRYSQNLNEEDRERVIEGVLDISKEISRCLERDREKNVTKSKRTSFCNRIENKVILNMQWK